jgi:hypothetical protein
MTDAQENTGRQETTLCKQRSITKIVESSKKSYALSEFATLNEKLEAFRDRCGFRQ